jgi:hypothetical protein
MVAKRTLQMYDAPSPFFAICPWLLADEDMGGSGWPFDAWHGWAHSEKYGSKKPVITLLEAVPPKEIAPRSEPAVIDLNGDSRDWAWAKETFGTGYRRGKSRMRLIEVHEHAGPARLAVWAVDADGLPLEGVPFCYCHPQAPPLGEEGGDGAGDEWYAQAVVKTTGPDGRLSFPASGHGRGAVWPKGKGDLLENVELKPGGPNRHLNGMWQAVEDWAPDPPPDDELPPPGDPSPPSPPPPSPTDGQWDLVFEKLDRIEELVANLK